MTTLSKIIAVDGTELALDGTQGIKVLRGVAGLDGLPRMNILDPRVSVDGSARTHTRLGERAVTLPVMIDENTLSPGYLARFVQGPCTLVASSNRSLRNVVYESGLEAPRDGAMGGIDGLGWRKFNLHLVALDPWWYGELQNVSGLFDSPTPWNASIPWNSNIPWNGGASVEVFVAGDAPALPTVVVTGAADQVAFAVGGRGGWEIDASIPSGTYVSVSSEVGRSGPHRGPHGFFPAADGPIDWSLLREGSQLFMLPPGPTSIVFSASGTDGNSAWAVYWHSRYLTP